MRVYAVWKLYPFAHPSYIILICKYKARALAKAEEFKKNEPPERAPEYDSYGLCGGIDYTVEEITVDEEEA